MKDLFVDSFLIFKYTIVYCHIMCTCNQMRVPFFSRSFLTIIESILDKIKIITPNQRMFLFILKKKSILMHMLKIRTQYVQVMIKIS